GREPSGARTDVDEAPAPGESVQLLRAPALSREERRVGFPGRLPVGAERVVARAVVAARVGGRRGEEDGRAGLAALVGEGLVADAAVAVGCREGVPPGAAAHRAPSLALLSRRRGGRARLRRAQAAPPLATSRARVARSSAISSSGTARKPSSIAK